MERPRDSGVVDQGPNEEPGPAPCGHRHVNPAVEWIPQAVAG